MAAVARGFPLSLEFDEPRAACFIAIFPARRRVRSGICVCLLFLSEKVLKEPRGSLVWQLVSVSMFFGFFLVGVGGGGEVLTSNCLIVLVVA